MQNILKMAAGPGELMDQLDEVGNEEFLEQDLERHHVTTSLMP